MSLQNPEVLSHKIIISLHWEQSQTAIIQTHIYSFISSVMSNHKTKTDEEEKMLEEFLRLKPTRAIDRLLNQHNIDKVYSIYNTLQEKIRKNTSDLRATLTNKYQNLVDCSNLLTTIQTFTNQIEVIAGDIDKAFKKDRSDLLQSKKSKVNPIANIEEQIHRKKYSSAMKRSHEVKKQDLEQSQIQYLPFLRIQILEALQKELINKKITQSFIAEVVSCLSTFIHSLSDRDFRQISQTKYEQGTLLALVSECLRSKGDEKVGQSQILQILFKCKLFSLNRTVRQAQQYDKISKFFYDILQLLSEEDRQSGAGQLTSIFCSNIGQIEAHLSQTFISSSTNNIIMFKYDLYEKLLSSEQFVQVLRQLHEIIGKGEGPAPTISLHESFLNLWTNYYRQLLGLLFNKCNPVHYIPIESQKGQKQMPRELAKYVASNEIQIENVLKQFKVQLQLFYNNILQLVSKAQELTDKAISQETSLKQIVNQYEQNVQKMNSCISSKLQELASSPSPANLRSTILLFLLSNEFNIQVQQHFNKHQILKALVDFNLKWNQDLVQKYSSVFKKGKANNWTINFDHFFMHYAGLVSSNKIELVRKTVVSVIEGMMLQKSPAEAEKCIEEHHTKKRKAQKLEADEKGRLRDLVVSEVGGTAFAKKKLLTSQG